MARYMYGKVIMQDDPFSTSPNRPILVTGAHRSGTTWVGKMLAAHPQVAYISEPLNVWHRLGVMRLPVKHWYSYICSENENHYLPALREMLSFDYHFLEEVKSLKTWKDFLRMGRDWSTFLAGKWFQKQPLLKDPFAVFSSGWFYQRLNCRVIIVIRHPAAVVSSLTRLGWAFDFSDLLEQPFLMRDWLGPFRLEMETLLNQPTDILAQSCLLWRMIYHVAFQIAGTVPACQIIRHEDLALSPVEGYRHLYSYLGLNFTSRVEHIIGTYSNEGNPAELSRRKIHSTKLDSQAALSNWKKRLTSDEITRIRWLTIDVAENFYGPEWWE